MDSGYTFGAPWGTSLRMMTGFAVCLLAGISVIGFFTGPKHMLFWNLSMSVLPLGILIAAVFFIIRGYVVTEDTLIVKRPGWSVKIDLKNLQSVKADPQAMAGSIRTFGNGGLFCFSGSFRNKKLGSYRAFVTDQKLSVILKFTDRTIVVTPDKPDIFVNKLLEIKHLSQ